ncbi:MAG TPA: feruloyl-CoA synthase [Methylomirabilota bacterium]|nr:feruloyl-CoA synthase [Methylomirabilota bacterium]
MTSHPASALRFAPVGVEVEHRPDGTLLLRSPQALSPYGRALGEWLTQWAARRPGHVFLAERAGASWRTVTYQETLDAARRIGQSLLDLGLTAERPVMILSDNSVDHALLALGAMHVGVPVAPISPAYSLMSRAFGKLRHINALIRPGLVWASDPAKFAAALDAINATVTPMATLLGTTPTSRVDEAFAGIDPDTIAKILFTSGSTGTPKGVVNTHRMLCANQQMLAQGWPFLEERPPVIVDWLPWNHTFGGNHNFNMVLRNGGTLYVDGGKPAPGLVETTVRNLREVAPTMYFNVPRGFDLLVPFLESDPDLRRTFFSRLDLVFYAGAALPQPLWDRLRRVAEAENAGGLAMLSAWGSTETAPLATHVHFAIDRAGVIGLPVPGCELKLLPSGGKLEARVRGPHVTPGYYRNAAETRTAFDEEGFYRIGDALTFANPTDPAKGLVFDGRVAEDFKLATGTWVHTGAVRIALIAAGSPLIQDAVITGHDRDVVGALVFLNPAATSGLSPAVIRTQIASALTKLATESKGSSTYPARALVMTEPPSIDADEITDKGYINQRMVRERRAALVEALYAVPPPAELITAQCVSRPRLDGPGN